MAKGWPATTVAGVNVSTSPGVDVPQFGTRFAAGVAVGTAGKYCVKVTNAATPATAAMAIIHEVKCYGTQAFAIGLPTTKPLIEPPHESLMLPELVITALLVIAAELVMLPLLVIGPLLVMGPLFVIVPELVKIPELVIRPVPVLTMIPVAL